MACAALEAGGGAAAESAAEQQQLSLYDAVLADDAEAVAAALAAPLDPDAPFGFACGITPTQLAALCGKLSALRALHRLGASLTACHPKRMLGWAAAPAAAALVGRHHPQLCQP